MRLHNQTGKALAWDMAGRRFECDPWGSVEVPEDLVPYVKRRGVPLGQAPVAPERKASNEADEAKRKARNDEVRLLKQEVHDLKAQLAVQVDTSERHQETIGRLKAAIESSEKERDTLTLRAEAAERDVGALKHKLEEQSAELVAMERERGKPAQSQPPQQRQEQQKHQQHKR